jgi:transcriptional regulator with XRE-family HTH domain
MPIRIKSPGHRQQHFIKEWRKAKHLTQDQLAEKMGVSKATISRIESYDQPYTQDFLEFCSLVLNVSVAALLSRSPTEEDEITPLVERARPAQRKKILKAIKEIIGTPD